MSSIKKLASQTFWYGLSSIAARFINYLLTPFLTYSSVVKTSDYGKVGLIYSAIPILNVIFTYGLETAYFRFASKEQYKKDIYSTAAISLLVSSVLLGGLLWMGRNIFASAIGLQDFPQIIEISIFIIALDAMNKIPLARLRQQERPVKFAFVNIASIIITVYFTWFFIGHCPGALQKNSGSWVRHFYNTNTNPVVYILIANLIGTVATLLLLLKEFGEIQLKFNTALWKEMMIYALPLVIAGMGGMINETFDRLMLRWWLPGSTEYRETQVGIYNACYKLSILITLFIQAFRMGAEPFFFKQAEGENPQKVYARVMKFFVITISIMFLAVSLYLPVWKYFIGKKYWEGLAVVPVLLLANMSLGIYYNLSIWYKLAHKTMAGAWITLLGAAITFLINSIFIPRFGYMASAWATFCCYTSMMLISYSWGQKVYPIPYARKKLLAYLVIAVMIFFLYSLLNKISSNIIYLLFIATLLTAGFIIFIFKIEKKEFQRLPFIGKYIK